MILSSRSPSSPPSSAEDTIVYPLFVFLLSLFTLERAADLFIASTARVARRLRVSETLVSLLTAGAEWEELVVVVVATFVLRRPRLALGTILGSCVANVLGAFSLGLLVLVQRRDDGGFVAFDASARRYTVVSLAVATAVSVLWGLGGLGGLHGHLVGAVLVVVFAVYVAAVAWAIYRGVLDAPEDSDEESDGSSASEASSDAREESHDERDQEAEGPTESDALLHRKGKRLSAILTDVVKLMVGFIALSMSGYVLSHASKSLATSLNISDSVFGATLLSLATTLPEKFIAVISGARGHPGIMVANTVGSNIFLLTLCLGVTILGSPNLTRDSNYAHEMAWMWASSAFLTLVVMVGSHRLIGAIMLLAYLAFLILEFMLFQS